ncbi:MAG: AmmeMemoRadiSam system protein B [Conexivisphaera sp.]
MKVRRPAVAGYFYPASTEELSKLLRSLFLHQLGPGKLPPAPPSEDLIGIISPHAGYEYSGPVAAHGYYAASGTRPDTVIVLGPNHHGIGSGVAVSESDSWETPLGSVEVDRELASRIVRLSSIVDFDDLAHWKEHSIEVQVPFAQFSLAPGFRIVPISMMMQDELTAVEVGDAIARAVQELGRRPLLVASTDFTHYEPYDEAYRRDAKAIEAIRSMDISELYRVIEAHKVSMCGYGAVAAVLAAARRLGAARVELLKYATSGDTSGDRSMVVGYGSLAILSARREAPGPLG